MSRGQQNDTFNTAQQENQQYNQNAQTAFNQAQGDINDMSSAVAKYAASNPYGQGGQFQTSQNQILANTSDAAAKAAGQALQSAAVRTGQNSGGAIAATEAMQEQNERNLSSQDAQANQQRIADQAKYNESALNQQGKVESMQDQLAQQQGAAAQGALGTQEQAAQQPSFLDSLGNSFLGGMGQMGSAAITKYCWIAAELYGGWNDARTILMQRWLASEFGRTWWGRLLLRAYTVWGARIAKEMRSKPRLRAFFQWLFDAGLDRARKWEQGERRRFTCSLYGKEVSHG
jgi:hypothetical protein